MSDFKSEMLVMTANRAVEMQNEFLNQFVDNNVRNLNISTEGKNFDVLLKETYIALLEDIRQKICTELEYNTNE